MNQSTEMAEVVMVVSMVIQTKALQNRETTYKQTSANPFRHQITWHAWIYISSSSRHLPLILLGKTMTSLGLCHPESTTWKLNKWKAFKKTRGTTQKPKIMKNQNQEHVRKAKKWRTCEYLKTLRVEGGLEITVRRR